MKILQGRGMARFADGRHAEASCLDRPADLPVGEQFVLWALRQWQSELKDWERNGAFPAGGSVLRHGFELAGLLDALPEFAMAMDAILFGLGRALEIHQPPCSAVSRDEAVLIALCELAQAGRSGPLRSSLWAMLCPETSAVVGARLTAFATMLSAAGLELGSVRADAGHCLH
jgi:hypothetical protein